MIDAIKYILCAVIGYLLGCFSTGILISRKEGHDIRQEGSKNTGASNVLRVLGPRLGALTFLGDFLKATLAILIGQAIAGQNGGMLGALFAVLGHNWPVFFGFKGGKGIACSTAILLIIFTWQGAIAVVLCLIVIAVTRYISLGSMVMLTCFAILMLFTAPFWPAGVWAIALAALGIYRHRANIQRLLNGTENKLGKK